MAILIAAVKNPISYATLALLMIAGLAYSANAPLLAIILLAGYSILVLVLLLRADNAVRADPAQSLRWYPNIQAIYPEMTALIERSVEAEKHVSVEVLGLKLNHMWEYVRNFLNDDKIKNLTIRLATISGTAWQQKHLKTNWAELSEAFCRSIADYQEAHAEDLQRRGIKICVYRYDHLPMFHGILIDDEHLFFSLTSWNSKRQMEGASTFYCYYNTDSRIGKSYIQVFRSWLVYVRGTQTGNDAEQHTILQ